MFGSLTFGFVLLLVCVVIDSCPLLDVFCVFCSGCQVAGVQVGYFLPGSQLWLLTGMPFYLIFTDDLRFF